jgi:hypothetical protein
MIHFPPKTPQLSKTETTRPIYSNKEKIISLHTYQDCHTNCPNQSVCYHRKRRNVNVYTSIYEEYIKEWLENKYQVYDALVDKNIGRLELYYLFNRDNYNNYHITVSSNERRLSLSTCDKAKAWELYPNLNLTVYTIDEMRKYARYNKMFLVHSFQTLNLMANSAGSAGLGNIHYNVDQEFITPQNIKTIMSIMNDESTEGKTLDTCLSSWVVNGKCPYEDNYIDIDSVGAIRKCPFSVYEQGGYTSLTNIDKAFELKYDGPCKYREIFNKEKS